MSKKQKELTRLEIIKTNWEYDHINTCDVDWLIKQAELAQEEECYNVLEGLYEENKRLRKALEFYAEGKHVTGYGAVARKALEGEE